MSRTLFLAAVCVLLILPAGGAAAVEPEPSAESEEGIWTEVQRLYERAKAAGETVPEDAVDWVQQDLARYGDWEYRVVESSSTERALAETELNDLGKERWECFWVEARGSRTRFYFKRPSRSYLRNLPLSDLMKVVPTPDGGGGGE